MKPAILRVFGVLGFPVAHSKSPAMHNAAFRALGLDAVYVPFAVEPGALGDALAGVRALGLGGVSLTLPHKEAALSLMDEVESEARAVGAINTVLHTRRGLTGANTDAKGLASALVEAGIVLRGCDVVVLGAVGAARAAVMGLRGAGAGRICVAARRVRQAERLIATLPASDTEHSASSLGPELAGSFAGADVLVQASSATLGDTPEARAFASALPIDRLPQHCVVHDLAYSPLVTSVLERAREHGLQTVDGLTTLLHQGALAFERWTGRDAPLAVMRAALYAPEAVEP